MNYIKEKVLPEKGAQTKYLDKYKKRAERKPKETKRECNC